MKDSLAMLLKTNIGKMVVFGPLAMLLIKNGLQDASGDVDEKTESYEDHGEAGPGLYCLGWSCRIPAVSRGRGIGRNFPPIPLALALCPPGIRQEEFDHD